MSKLIGQKVECKDRPNEVGVISLYSHYTGDMDIKYEAEEDIYLTNISKCKVVK
nr:MAG TPA: hypothetical protein [Caudoviricetes sp.]